jgi:hypothetical protein
MTLEEFKSLVKNRPEPDTPGFYCLGILFGHGIEAQKGEYRSEELNASTKQRREGVAPYTIWRYASSYVTCKF